MSSTEALPNETLSRLLETCRRLGITADLTAILSSIIDAMRDLLNADRATVFEYDAGGNQLFATVAHGLGEAVGMVRISATEGLAGAAAQTRRTILVQDAYADPRFNPAVDRRTGYRTKSILSIPLLSFGDELIGVAQVLNKRTGHFDESDVLLAGALAAQAAVAIKRARLVEDQLRRKKMERDLEVAREIQQETFPREFPVIPGLDLAAWSEPAERTGGDTYDVIPIVPPECLDQPSAADCNRALLMLADATGHGIGPSLVAAGMRAMLRMAARLGAKPAEIIDHLNRQLLADTPAGLFVSAWIGLVDSDGSLASFSAGQAPLLLLRGQTGQVSILGADTFPFGIAADLESRGGLNIQLGSGDVFMVVSDGIVETHNSEGDAFGSERLAEALRTHRHLPAREIIEAIVRDVLEFGGHQAPVDDRTAVVLKRL